MRKLTPQAKKLLAFMEEKGCGVDVSIAEMFHCLNPGADVPDSRKAQQRVGAVVARVHRGLGLAQGDRVIVPGQVKRTYRLLGE